MEGKRDIMFCIGVLIIAGGASHYGWWFGVIIVGSVVAGIALRGITK